MTSRPRTAVAHLVWGPAGLEPYSAFLESYAAHDAGAEHDLVLVFNGFHGEPSLRPFRARAADLRPRELVIDQPCLDIAAYLQAAARLEHERLCILNSYSTPLADGWLATLEAPLAARAVGAAGATGSYASHISYHLFALGLRSAYGDALGNRATAREVMHELSGERPPGPVKHGLYSLAMLAKQRRGSQRFPAPHLRTNGFVIDRALFAEVCPGPARTKWETHLIESGPGSITARLVARGRPPVVVDRSGAAREIGDWHRGDVFMQAGQEDLLIADNQTRSYTAATSRQRAVLSASAWGPWSRPA